MAASVGRLGEFEARVLGEEAQGVSEDEVVDG